MSDGPWMGDVVSLVDAFRSGERHPTEELAATLAAVEALVSSDGRDELVESFGWGVPVERFSWSFVEEPSDLVEVALRVR